MFTAGERYRFGRCWDAGRRGSGFGRVAGGLCGDAITPPVGCFAETFAHAHEAPRVVTVGDAHRPC